MGCTDGDNWFAIYGGHAGVTYIFSVLILSPFSCVQYIIFCTADVIL